MAMRWTSHETYETVFSVAYLGLVTNALLAVGLAPLLAVLMTTDPESSWPLLAVLLPLTTPALAAAFAVFSAYSADPTIGVIRTFATAWRASFRRAATIGALAAATLVVLGVDAQATGGYPRLLCVIAADLWKLAQARPGSSLRFVRCTPARAREAWAAQCRELGRLRLVLG